MSRREIRNINVNNFLDRIYLSWREGVLIAPGHLKELLDSIVWRLERRLERLLESQEPSLWLRNREEIYFSLKRELMILLRRFQYNEGSELDESYLLWKQELLNGLDDILIEELGSFIAESQSLSILDFLVYPEKTIKNYLNSETGTLRKKIRDRLMQQHHTRRHSDFQLAAFELMWESGRGRYEDILSAKVVELIRYELFNLWDQIFLSQILDDASNFRQFLRDEIQFLKDELLGIFERSSWSDVLNLEDEVLPKKLKQNLDNITAKIFTEYGMTYYPSQDMTYYPSQDMFMDLPLIIKTRRIPRLQLAQSLMLSPPLLQKLLHRYFLPNTIPQALVEQIARTLELPLQEVRTYFQGPPIPLRGAAYRAERAPTPPTQEDFWEALEKAKTLTEEQKRYWHKLRDT